MTQTSLFDADDDAPAPARNVALSALAGGGAALGRVQKQFNKLLAKIEAQRRELAEWNAFVPVFLGRMSAELRPLEARYRERRIAMVQLLDRAMGDKALGKAHRTKVHDILMNILGELMAAGDDAVLIALYDKHADMSFAEEQQVDMEIMKSMATEALGVPLDDDHGATTPEELQRVIADKLAAAQAEAEAAAARRPGRKRSAKAIAGDAVREQTAQGASQAVREIYRKLASELHPDRETDPVERERKTALMKQVNQAYEARDLLALLELQLSVQQIDPAALANIAEDRLLHYNALLREQSQRLQDELADVIAPFLSHPGGPGSRQVGIEMVQRSLDVDIRNFKESIRAIDADLLRFEDIQQLKASLKHYRIGSDDDDEVDMALIAALLSDAVKPPRRRRR